jgi:soluble lytic murein transglycosylase
VLRLVRQHRRGASESWRERLADAVYEESVAAGVDPLLIASLVARESSFRSRAVSHKGAVGLMQLRPWVAEELARRCGVGWEGTTTLLSPELNVRLGIFYYKELVRRFDGDEHKALTAYNYGPSRVRLQIRRGTYSGSSYADRILSLYEEWHARRSAPPTEST